MEFSRKVLLSFAGFHDPYSMGLVENEEQPGPILTLVQNYVFGRVILFGTPDTLDNTVETKYVLESKYPSLIVEICELSLNDLTDYAAIMSQLRVKLTHIEKVLPNCLFFVSVTSCTPQIHACWAVLLKDGEFSARILNVRPPRFATDNNSFVDVIDIESSLAPPVMEKKFDNLGGVLFSLDETLIIEDKEPSRRKSQPQTIKKVIAPLKLNEAKQKLGIVGEHPKILEVLERVEIAAPTDMNVLIQGETGTGKELFAKLIHILSDRITTPFVPLNCGAIPKELIESTLFGHVKGAFTGATKAQVGKFEAANGGTLFLDELAELLPETQVKLLRVIEDGIIQPIGSLTSKKVDVRLVAATNKDLRVGVANCTFRDDLYYRLTTVQLNLPPLRERSSDIPLIALQLLDDINKRLRHPKRFSHEALTRLQRYTWPGNVRSLRNALIQSAIFCKKDVIQSDDLVIPDTTPVSDPLDYLPEPKEGFDINQYLDSVRKQLFLRAITIAEMNKSKAARLLGVSPQAVHKFFLNDES